MEQNQSFARNISLDAIYAGEATRLRAEAAEFAARNGADAYTGFLLKHGARPDRKQAAVIGRLLGKRVRASDGSLQPLPTKHERSALRLNKLTQEAARQVDVELSRTLDALEYLSRNKLDAAPLIARISTPESEIVSAKLKFAVEWLKRFAEGWRRHEVFGNDESEDASPRSCKHDGPRRLRLVSCGD